MMPVSYPTNLAKGAYEALCRRACLVEAGEVACDAMCDRIYVRPAGLCEGYLAFSVYRKQITAAPEGTFE